MTKAEEIAQAEQDLEVLKKALAVYNRRDDIAPFSSMAGCVAAAGDYLVRLRSEAQRESEQVANLRNVWLNERGLARTAQDALCCAPPRDADEYAALALEAKRAREREQDALEAWAKAAGK